MNAQILGFSASSAGTRAVINAPVHSEAATVLKRLGGYADSLAARQLTKIASGADLIIAVTASHQDRMPELAPQKLNRTFTHSEAAAMASKFGADGIPDLAGLRPLLGVDDRLDAPDSIGKSAAVFESTGELIADLLPSVIDFCRHG